MAAAVSRALRVHTRWHTSCTCRGGPEAGGSNALFASSIPSAGSRWQLNPETLPASAARAALPGSAPHREALPPRGAPDLQRALQHVGHPRQVGAGIAVHGRHVSGAQRAVPLQQAWRPHVPKQAMLLRQPAARVRPGGQGMGWG